MNAIDLPPVRQAGTTTVIDKNEAAKRAGRPVYLEYDYNDATWTILVNPNAILAADEEELQEIQLRLANEAEIDPARQKELSEKAENNEFSIEEARKLTKANSEFRKAQCVMLAKAVIGCNDPIHEVNEANLIKGGKVANLQLKTLSDWWFPTAPDSKKISSEKPEQSKD